MHFTLKALHRHAVEMMTAYMRPRDAGPASLGEALALGVPFDHRIGNACFSVVRGEGGLWVYVLGTTTDRGLAEFVDDMKQNLDLRTVSVSGGKMLGGFAKHGEAIAKWLEDNRLEVDGFVGHSLGGAAAESLSLLFRRPCITFGQPRLWRRLPETAIPHARVYTPADVVVTLPPSVSLGEVFSWAHRHTQKVRLPGNRWLSAILDWILRRDRFRHHYMANYVRLLAREIDAEFRSLAKDFLKRQSAGEKESR